MIQAKVLTKEMIRDYLPERKSQSHKGTYGRLDCVAGSRAYFGAGLLAARAGLHMGTGMVYWHAPDACDNYWKGQTPELIFTSHPSYQGHFSAESATSIIGASRQADAMLVGPGIVDFPAGCLWLSEIINAISCPLLVDADGINLLANNLDILLHRGDLGLPIEMVLTPHLGEFARLVQLPVEDLLANDMELVDRLAIQFAIDYHLTLVVKSHKTIIALPSGDLYVNSTGNHCLAKAGSGDVLAGMIAGLMAQGLDGARAACLGVYLHGASADILAPETYVSTMASDVSANIGRTILELIGQ